MDYETKKKNLLWYWMLTHQNLGEGLQQEFLNHPTVKEILKYDLKFARYAIEKEKKALLPEILEVVKGIERERIELRNLGRAA